MDKIECPYCGKILEEEWGTQSDDQGNEHDCLMGHRCPGCFARFHANGEEK
jgi:hypothetical protein